MDSSHPKVLQQRHKFVKIELVFMVAYVGDIGYILQDAAIAMLGGVIE